MDIIKKYSSKPELEKKVISLYKSMLRKEIALCKKILLDKEWASNGSDYHKKCRQDMAAEIKEMKAQIRILS